MNERVDRWRSAALYGGVLAIAAAAHAPTVANGFVLDDDLLFEQARSAPSLAFLLRQPLFFSLGDLTNFPFYRPLSTLLYWLTGRLFHENAALHHAFGVALHAAVALLLARAIRAYGGSRAGAFASAAIFAAHPATAEIAAYIGGRQDMLGWIAALVATILAANATPKARAVIAFVATAVAALCREWFLALPVVLAAMAYAAAAEPVVRRRYAAWTLAGGLLGSGSVIALRAALHVAPLVGGGAFGAARLSNATAFVALRWIKVALVPTDLAPDVSVARYATALVAAVLLATALLLALGARAALRMEPPRGALVAGGVAIVGAGVVVHALGSMRLDLISDRYAYVFLAGCALGAAPFVDMVVASPRKLVSAAPALLAVVLIPLTWSRDVEWKDDATLERALFATRPEDPQTQLIHGERLLDEGRTREALTSCRAYEAARPGSDRADLCIGVGLLSEHDAQGAVPYLRRFVATRSDRRSARHAYLAALLATGATDEIRARLDAWQPRYPDDTKLAEVRAIIDAR